MRLRGSTRILWVVRANGNAFLCIGAQRDEEFTPFPSPSFDRRMLRLLEHIADLEPLSRPVFWSDGLKRKSTVQLPS